MLLLRYFSLYCIFPLDFWTQELDFLLMFISFHLAEINPLISLLSSLWMMLSIKHISHSFHLYFITCQLLLIEIFVLFLYASQGSLLVNLLIHGTLSSSVCTWLLLYFMFTFCCCYSPLYHISNTIYSPYILPHHIGTALESKQTNKRIKSSTMLTFPCETGISLHLFIFIHPFNEYCFSAFHDSNSSLKAEIILDKNFFVSFNKILVFFYKYFLHLVRSLSMYFKFCHCNERRKIFHYIFLN